MKSSKTVKIQHQNRIFKIIRPRNYCTLRAECQARFGLTDNAFYIVYLDNKRVKISVESDDDYSMTEFETPQITKLLCIGPSEKRSFSMEKTIPKAILQRLVECIEGKINEESIDDLQILIDKGEMPCYECCDIDLKTAPEIDKGKETCRRCKGIGLLPNKSVWLSLISVIEAKLKMYILDPLKAFELRAENESIFGGKFWHDYTQHSNISILSQALNTSGLNKSTNSEFEKSKPELKKGSKLCLSKTPYSIEMLSKNMDTFYFEHDSKENSNNTKTNRLALKHKQSPNKSSEKICVFKNPPADLFANTADYRQELLPFLLPTFDAWLIKKNQVEVKLFVENNTTEDWPEDVKIIGRSECKLTHEVCHSVNSRLRALSRIGIKFCFEVNENDLNKETRNELEFQFIAFNHAEHIKYTANFTIPLFCDKKKSKILFCKFI